MADDVAELQSVGAGRFFQGVLRGTTIVGCQSRPATVQLMRDFGNAHPSCGGHGRCNRPGAGLDADEAREKVRSYQERYDIPTEDLR